MSKPVVKFQKKNEITKQNNNFASPALREAKPPVVSEDKKELNVIAVYKDLNEPLRAFARNQNKQLFIGFVFFLILGLGILMGQHFGKKRAVASADMAKFIPANAETTSSEHYYYDKSCYKGEGGELVCMTRTSQQR